MTDMTEPAEPSVSELQQHDLELVTLPVKTVGPVLTHELPARTGPMFMQALSTTWQNVLGADEKRSRVVLLCSTDWEISRTGNAASGVSWPADVPLVLTHCDAIHARVPSETGMLSVLTEVYAD